MKDIKLKRYSRTGEHTVDDVKYEIRVEVGVVSRCFDGKPFRTAFNVISFINGVPYSVNSINNTNSTVHEVMDDRIRTLKEDMDFEFSEGYSFITPNKSRDKNG